MLLVVFGAAAAAGRPQPQGSIGVLGFQQEWQDGSGVESGGLNYPTDIYVVDVARRSVRNLTRDARTEYCWSWLAHGRGVVFTSVPNDRMKPGPTVIDVVTVDGGRRRRLLSSTGDICPSLSPDRRRILFVIQSGRQRGLYVMRIDGSHEQRLTRSREDAFAASWSPDGKRIVFVRRFHPDTPRSGSDIYVINADGTGLHRLTRTKGDEEEPTWSPDGRQIAFTRGPVFTMRPDGTNVKQLTRKGSASSPMWMSNGRIVFFEAISARWWTVDTAARAVPRPLPPSTRVGDSLLNLRRAAFYFGALRPGGTSVAYSTVGPRLWVADRNGRHGHVVWRAHCCWRLYLAWAPE